MMEQVFGTIEVSIESAMSTPRQTPEGKPSTASALVVKLKDVCVIFVEDHAHGCSVTNGAEKVCRFIHDQLLADIPYSGIRWVYKDTNNEVDEIVTDGVSASFQHIMNDDDQVSRAVQVVRAAGFMFRSA